MGGNLGPSLMSSFPCNGQRVLTVLRLLPSLLGEIVNIRGTKVLNTSLTQNHDTDTWEQLQ